MESRLITTLLDLLRIPSVTGSEQACCDYVEREIKALEDVPLVRIGNSIVAGTFPSAARKPLIGLFGHLDTVPGVCREPIIADGRVTGLGASDMKAGIAVMLEVARTLRARTGSYDIVYVFYDREEGPYANNGLHVVFNELPELKHITFGFVLEPSNGDLHAGCMGGGTAKVVFSGVRAHSARPWEGENAIHKAAAFMGRVASLNPVPVRVEGLEYRGVTSVTMAAGGIATNVIPDRFELTVNMRIPPGHTVEEARSNFLRVTGSEPHVEFVDSYPAALPPKDGGVYKSLKDRFKLSESPKQAYTDVALLGTQGVEAVNFGPGLTAQAHQKDEYVEISDVVRVFEIYRSFLE